MSHCVYTLEDISQAKPPEAGQFAKALAYNTGFDPSDFIRLLMKITYQDQHLLPLVIKMQD